MSSIDLPPGLGLQGTPLATFHAPARARRLAGVSLVAVVVLGALTWYLVSQQRPYRWHATTQVVLPVAFAAFTLIGYGVRRARIAITRDGLRWGWEVLSFTQDASRIIAAHVYADGVAFEATRGSRWFISARDWDRFDGFVRQLRRAELPIVEHTGNAPLRARLQSYGRFLDGLLVLSVVGCLAVALWAA